MNLRNHTAAVALALGLAVGLSACGGEPEVCADVASLRADLDDLKAIKVQPGSLDDFSAAFDEVGADVNRLVENAASEYENEIGAVKSATNALTTSVKTAAEAPSGATISQVSTDFGTLRTAVDRLQEAVGDTC